MNVDNYVKNFQTVEHEVSRQDAIQTVVQALFTEMDEELKAMKNKADSKKLFEIMNKYAEKWIRIANRVHADKRIFSATVKKLDNNLWMQWQHGITIPAMKQQEGVQ